MWFAKPISAPIATTLLISPMASRCGWLPRFRPTCRWAAECDCASRPNIAVRWRAEPLGGTMMVSKLISSLFGLLALATSALAATPAPTSITPALVEAAKKEGTVVFYTSIELQTAEKLAKAFEAAHPGIKVQVERNGCERLVQRLGQERGSGIKAADIGECSDMTALLDWKRQGWLAPFVPADVEKWPAEQRDADGFFATERLTLSPIAYNTRLIKPEEAPKSYADLLDPKWKGKIVKAHPGYR